MRSAFKSKQYPLLWSTLIDSAVPESSRNGHLAGFHHSKKVPKLTEDNLFHPFFGGVSGQKSNCSDEFWEQNKIDPQSGCWLFAFALNLGVSFQQTFF
jgi:hypothetical protein